MDSKRVFPFWTPLILVLFVRYIDGKGANGTTFPVTNFGAVADGKTDSASAFKMAWQQACKTNEGILEVPEGTFLLSVAQFEGPCVGKTGFNIEGIVIAQPESNADAWISFGGVNGLTLYGGGTFDGNGEMTWKEKSHCNEPSDCKAPTSLRFSGVTNVEISGIKSKDSKMFHFRIDNSQTIKMHDILIQAPADSPNTDGIHLRESSNVLITRCSISTGDDCISIGDKNTDINITSINCGPGHGISIGSLGKYSYEGDVTGVSVSDCSITDTENGLRIKTFSPSSVESTVSEITYTNIAMQNVKNPIIIDQNYCPHCNKVEQERSVKISNVKYINVHGTSATPVGVALNCSESSPCNDIEFKGLDLTLQGAKPAMAVCHNTNTEFNGPNQVPNSCNN